MLNKTENALLIAEVGVSGLVTADITITATDYARNDLIANFEGVAGRVFLNVYAERDNLARSLVT